MCTVCKYDIWKYPFLIWCSKEELDGCLTYVVRRMFWVQEVDSFVPLCHPKGKRPKGWPRWHKREEQRSWATEWKLSFSVTCDPLISKVHAHAEYGGAEGRAQGIQDLCWRIASQLPLLTRQAVWNTGIIPHAGEPDKVFFNGIFSHKPKDVRRLWERTMKLFSLCEFNIVLHPNCLMIHFHVPPWKREF